MELLVGLLFAILLGALIGVRVQQRLQIPYKQRWQEAVALLDPAVEATKEELERQAAELTLREERVKAAEDKTGLSYARPMPRSAWGSIFIHDRADHEISRMANGFPPGIPLQGIFIHDREEVLDAWLRAGWSWDGKGWTRVTSTPGGR